MNTDRIREFTLWARTRLVRECEELLLQVYGLKDDGSFLPEKLPALQRVDEARRTRKKLERLLRDEKDAGLTPKEAYQKLVKEVAYTHLNRLVALKLLEGRKLTRAALDKHHLSNGLLMYLGEDEYEVDRKLYDAGSAPVDDLDEGPRDRAYRHFLLWQYRQLANEVRVLFDPENVPSLLFPRPKALREVIDELNKEDLKEAWEPGNEETIGWVYQFFIAEEKAAAFKRVFKDKKKFRKEDIPAATQVFTPRWIVKFLVHNSLGRMWMAMHPESRLVEKLDYLVPLPGELPAPVVKAVKEIRLLDPATGTMHFGLVAFDLLLEMYREEMENAGKPGWPATTPVATEQEIPAAILAKNLFGIDIDLRSVQLAALALFLRAKSVNKNAVLQEINLACADVAIFRGTHLNEVISSIPLPKDISSTRLRQFCESLEEASLMGSLVRVERHFEDMAGPALRRAVDEFARKQAEKGVDESYFVGETTKGLRFLDLLSRRYDIVFTNPPYMSSGNMDPHMCGFLRQAYKESKGDLYAAFVARCLELLDDGGRLGMITQQSFMFICSFEKLRVMLLGSTSIETMAHVGPRAFPEVKGEKVNATAFVLRRESFEQVRASSLGIFFRLVKEPDPGAKMAAYELALARWKAGERDTHVFTYTQGDFAIVTGRPWVYQITPKLRELFSKLPPLSISAEAKQGLATADNPRFIRFWWEVGLSRIGRNFPSREDFAASGNPWCPHMKGGSRRRWVANHESVINWSRDGAELFALQPKSVIRNAEYYFRPGITYNAVSSKSFCGMVMPKGFIFDSAGDCLFPKKQGDVMGLLALANSVFARGVLTLLNPTLNVYTSDLDRLPIPTPLGSELPELAREAVTVSSEFGEQDETKYEFVAPAPWPGGGESVIARDRQLSIIERRVDEEVYHLYGIGAGEQKVIEQELAEPAPTDESDGEETANDEEPEAQSTGILAQEELAAQWVSYSVGVSLGRFRPGVSSTFGCGHFPSHIAARLRDLTDGNGVMTLEEGHPDDLAARVIEILTSIFDDEEAATIIRAATGKNNGMRGDLEQYLLGDFFRDHVRRYRKRPTYWLIESPNRNYCLYLFHEKASSETLALIRGNRYLGGRVNRLERDLEQANLRESKTSGKESAEARRTAADLAEILDDLREFDQILQAATNYEIPKEDGGPKTVGWVPELDDGVLLNSAPLYRLLPSWRDVNPRRAWEELQAGKNDWAKTAMRYWPKRVREACKKNKSYAIAHGLA